MEAQYFNSQYQSVLPPLHPFSRRVLLAANALRFAARTSLRSTVKNMTAKEIENCTRIQVNPG